MKEQKETAPAKKPNFFLRVLAFVLTAAMVLGALALVVFRDELPKTISGKIMRNQL